MKLNNISSTILLLLTFCLAIPALSQTTGQQDLSAIRVDELNDDQIRTIIRQMQATGMVDAQLEEVAQARGMRSGEVQKLRERVNRINKDDLARGGQPQSPLETQQNGRQVNSRDTITRLDPRVELANAIDALKPKVFGADLFRNNSANMSFAPNIRLATPSDYQVGPDDQIIINVYGNSLANWALTVSPEGTILIPGIGILNLSGKTMEQATTLIKNRLIANKYDIGRGTNVYVSLGNIRSITVNLNGQIVKPGTYTLPSVATVFNALYEAGGPSDNGSFRQIQVIRNNRIVANLDAYDYILKGLKPSDIRLQDQDVIFVPVYNTRVELVGEIKIPAIFETLPNETLQDVINFAGGFTTRAYTALIRVYQNTARERKQSDVSINNFGSYKPMNGDKYFVDPILGRFENRVTITGAVFRAGQYELTPGLTIRQLIRKAEGLREDAFQNRGQILRLKDNLQTELIAFDIGQILSGQIPDIPLKREDAIMISSIVDLKEGYNYIVQGEVRHPGTFNFSEGMTLEDAIIQAGGLKESAALQRIDVSRRIKNSNVLSVSAKTADIFTLNVNRDLSEAARFSLQPFDIVEVRPSSGYEIQKPVQIAGEVLYPGPYTISKKNERISDFIVRAGGFTAYAFPEGASLKRPGPVMRDSIEIKKKIEEEHLKKLQRLQTNASDSTLLNAEDEYAIRNNYVGIDLPAILKRPGGKEDIFLEEGDILNIPKQLQTVTVSGEVLSPNTAIYIRNKSFKQYISNAGGFANDAVKRRSYILYANGSVKSTKKLFVFNNYPQVRPGAEIFVPQKAQNKKLSVTELVGISTGLASLAVIILSLIK